MRTLLLGSAVGGVIGALVALTPNDATACTPSTPPVLEVDPEEQAVDETPPGPPTITSVRAMFVEGDDECFGPHWGANVSLRAEDDRTPPEGLGFVATGLGADPGNAPAFVTRRLELAWSEDEPEATFELRAVDRAGNVGPSVVLHVTATEEAGGCSVSPGGAAGGAASWTLAALVVLVLRRVLSQGDANR